MTLRITVLGTGYLGATHAACMAELGFEVLGMDVVEEKVTALSEGRVPFYEPDLEPLLRKHVESGRLRFTTSYAEVAAFGDVHFLCVGTPQREGEYAADLRYVDAVVEGLAPHLDRQTLVVGKSTVPVGTAARLATRFSELAPAGAEAELAWNPEFLREGFAIEDTLRPDRLVIGVHSQRAEDTLREVYAQALGSGTPLIVTDFPTAELVKAASGQEFKQEVGIAVGGRLGVAFSERLGLQASGSYVPSGLRFAFGDTKQTTDASLFFGAAKLAFFVLPHTAPVSFQINGGLAMVKRGGEAYRALDDKTSLGGTVGAQLGLRLGPLQNIQLAVDTYLYKQNLDGLTTDSGDAPSQRDVQISIGFGLPLGR